MTSPDISISPDSIRQHADHIDAFTEDLDLALSAADTVAVDDQAYGVICSFLPKTYINALEDHVITGIKGCGNVISTTASALELVADSFETNEAETANQFPGE